VKITREEKAGILETHVHIQSIPGDAEAAKAEQLLQNAFLTISAKKDGYTVTIGLNEIYYMESIDRSLFIYTEKEVYESSRSLADMEAALPEALFLRISKAAILNTDKLRQVKAQLNGRYEATLLNGEHLIINRSYVPDLKRKFGI